MSWLDFLVKLNYKLYRRPIKWENRLLSPLRSIVRISAKFILPRYLGKKVSSSVKFSEKKTREKIIISLTSFPARIENIWQTIACLRLQSYPAEKIILWLSEDQFGSDYKLPSRLRTFSDDVFEVRWVKGDIRSHKKYYYIAKEFPDSLVLLVDDDIYYPTDMLGRLIAAHNNNPEAVICQYGYEMAYDADGSIRPYNTWKKVYKESVSPNLFFGSGGGTLLRLNSLYKDLLRLDLSTKLTPIADDVWLNAMVRLAGLKVIMIKTGHILPVSNKNDVRLASENRRLNKNDEQIHDVSLYYISALGKDPFAKL